MRSPRLALTLGDPAGVGPEVVLACLDEAEAGDLVVLGPESLRPPDVPALAPVTTSDPEAPWLALELERAEAALRATDAPLSWIPTPVAGPWTVGAAGTRPWPPCAPARSSRGAAPWPGS